MFLDEFEKYSSQREEGVKHISFRSTRPKILKKTHDLKIEESYGNYDLFFDVKGVLLNSVHIEKGVHHKIIYGYNYEGRLIAAMKVASEGGILLEISEFIYDGKGRIETETCTSKYYDLGLDDVAKYSHKYSENKEEVIITSDMEEDEARFYMTYDDKQRVIEEKAIRNKDELIWWKRNEFDETGNLVREISLDENGEQDGTYEFLPFRKKLSTGYKYRSKDLNYLKEYVFTDNERGHWVSQVMMNDGEPIYIYDRTIEYY